MAVGAAKELKGPRGTSETPLEFFSRFKGLSRGLNRRKDLPRNIEA
jgi:hypothetical protein